MLIKLLLVTLAELLCRADSAAVAGEPLRPDDSYVAHESNRTEGLFVLANGVGWGEVPALRSLQGVELQDCAEACRKEASCLLFDYCDVPASGCPWGLARLGARPGRVRTACSLLKRIWVAFHSLYNDVKYKVKVPAHSRYPPACALSARPRHF